jgi:hypothetical protein
MSDHIDGPRSIGEPAAHVTDLFAFTSPENPARTVLAKSNQRTNHTVIPGSSFDRSAWGSTRKRSVLRS